MWFHGKYRGPGKRSRRMRGRDYSAAGYYFITFNTYRRQHLLGTIEEGVTMLNECGGILLSEWRRLDRTRSDVITDICAIMPNHFHGLLYLQPLNGCAPAMGTGDIDAFKCRAGTLGAVVAQLKSRVTKRIREIPGHEHMRVWQENYHDRIIRDRRDLLRIRRYIMRNPACFGKKKNRKRGI